MHSGVLDAETAALVVIDIQEAFRGVIPDFDRIASRAATAARGFAILGLPVIVTEQYPKGLGRTAAEITAALPVDAGVVEKSTFSSCGASDFLVSLTASEARQVVVCGVETHICVSQTVHDLIDSGFHVHLLNDAVGSRTETDRRTGIEKMNRSGAVPSTVEMALFELMRDSKHEHFKAIQTLVK
jgi:nicotinamidase-related amidase